VNEEGSSCNKTCALSLMSTQQVNSGTANVSCPGQRAIYTANNSAGPEQLRWLKERSRSYPHFDSPRLLIPARAIVKPSAWDFAFMADTVRPSETAMSNGGILARTSCRSLSSSSLVHRLLLLAAKAISKFERGPAYR
jgi:hypothetical protein